MKQQIRLLALLFALSIQLIPLSPTVLAGPFDVTGRVLTDDGTGLSGVLIYAYGTSSGSLVRKTTTDDAGYFYLLLPSGSNDLVFKKKGYATYTKTISGSDMWINLGDLQMAKALQLSTTTSSRVASPGEKLLLPFTVSNIGEESEVVDFLVSKPEDWSTTILDQTGEITNVYLLPEATLTLQLKAIIPLASTGNNSLSLTAIGKTNSTLNFTIIVEPSDKRIISCQFPGKAWAPGETGLFQVRVTNPFGIAMRFRVTVDSAPLGWTAFVKSIGGEVVKELVLDSGEFADLIVEVYVPAEAPDGEYNIIFQVSSSATSEDLALLVVVQKFAAGIGVDLEATPPYIDAYADSQAKFRLKVKNRGGYDQLFDLDVSGLPPELSTRFEGPDEQEITRVHVEAGGSKEFYVVVALPKAAPLGRLDFVVSVASASVTKRAGLTLNVLGFYELTVLNINFYTRVSVGGETSYMLNVLNSGTHETTNVRVNVAGSIPDGFTVEVKPTGIPSLKPDGPEVFPEEFFIIAKTQADVNAGSYYLDFEVQSDQTEALPFTLRIEVAQQMSRIFIGGMLVVVALLGLFFIYRKFGRR